MSASQKKQLRKEQNAAKLTEKQQQEQKEAKKLRLYTALFAVAIALMLCVAIVVSINTSGIIPRNTTALVVDDTEVSAVELNYYYIDCISGFINTYGDYLSIFGVDSTTPLDEQVYDEESGETWADYFIDYAAESAKASYALYNMAVEAGYTLSEEDAQSLDNTITYLGLYASLYGYNDVDAYLTAMYGAGANEKTYRAYCEVQYIASDYSNDYYNGLTYTDEDILEALAENADAYTSYTYNYYYMPASSYYEGGTMNESGTVTYTEEEKEAGREACAKAANLLAAGSHVTVEEFDEAIQKLSINSETTAASTLCEDYLYASVSTRISDWVTDKSRVSGDIGAVPYYVTSTDDEGNETKTLQGYYVVFFVGSDDNLTNLINVRHILVSFEGGTEDEDGNVTYSEEEIAAAKASAEELLAQWQSGDATEESFAELANEHSDDTGSNTNGGLYEDVYPGYMVEAFNDWCFDESRKSGDVGIVETEYGFHVMYFSSTDETTYRDYMITADLRETEYADWEAEILESLTITVENTSYVNTSITLG